MHQDVAWYGGRPHPRRRCVKWGLRRDFVWTVEVGGLGPGQFVLDGGPSSPPEKKAQSSTQLLTHVYCGQTAGRIKMPLGTEVNFGLGDVVLDGVASPQERGTAPSFRFVFIVANRLYG